MPHATDSITNGEKSSSQFISQLTSYPAVNDSIETFKANPYGKRSIEIADTAYTRFAKPVEPYLETPYSYAKPYVQKADELASSGLNHVESHFPIVKEDTNTIVETTKGYIFWPFSYLTSTWQDEYKKTANHNGRGPGLTTSALALVSTELKIASDFFQTVADILGPKYEESKKKGADYIREAEKYAKIGGDKASEYAKAGQDQAQDLGNKGQDKAQELSNKGQEKADHVKKQAEGAKDEVHKKAQK